MSALETVRQTIAPLDANAMAAASARWDTLTKPRGSLGRLEALGLQVAGIVGHVRPRLTERLIFVLAGDHGVTAEGVSAYPVGRDGPDGLQLRARWGGDQCPGPARRRTRDRRGYGGRCRASGLSRVWSREKSVGEP